MAENSSIEWTDHTFNPWFGCQKVSPGCDHCYAEARMDTRLHRVQWGAGQPRARTKDWSGPERWNRRAKAEGRRMRVFCASLADVFDNQAPDEWRADLFALIQATPHLDWLLLTKRIGNAKSMLPPAALLPWSAHHAYRNLRIGATITSQSEADRDIPKLLDLPLPNFLSMEPLLGPVVLRPCWLTGRNVCVECGPGKPCSCPPAGRRLLWIIVGGESGHGARPMHPDWARSLRDQCTAAGVPFLFKQWGEWSPGYAEHGNDLGYDTIVEAKQHEWPEGHCAFRVGKKAAGRLLDGQVHDGFPEVR